MLVKEILLEKPVDSSWLVDISYNRKTKVARMTVTSGNVNGHPRTEYENNFRVYDIHNISRREFDKWHAAPSQGKYWHKFIAGFYDVTRVA